MQIALIFGAKFGDDSTLFSAYRTCLTIDSSFVHPKKANINVGLTLSVSFGEVIT